MSIGNKIRLVLLAILIVMVMWLKIDYDNNRINELNTKLAETEENNKRLENNNKNQDVIINNLQDKIYELENAAADGTKESNIDYFELREEILGFDVRKIEAADKSDWYYYNTLGDYEKEDYIKILYCLATMGSTSELKETAAEEVYRLYYCVTMDHETLFWVNGCTYKYSEEHKKYIFTGIYEQDLCINTVNLYNAWNEIKEYKNDVLSQMNNLMTDVEKELVIFNYIVTHTIYEKESFQNQSLYSVVREKSVCAGISKMFKYLCDEADIKCICIKGTHNESGIGHLWNLVQLEKENYFVDCTNSLMKFENGTIFINYEVFNTNREQLEKSYTIDEEYEIPRIGVGEQYAKS